MAKIMKRTQVYLTEQEWKLLLEEAKERGLSMSDILRRIIDEHFEEKAKHEPLR